MSTKHTPEPWSVADDQVWPGAVVVDGDLNMICDANIFGTNAPSEEGNLANADRIVACVNACAGLHTAALEEAPVGHFADELYRLRTELSEQEQRFSAMLETGRGSQP